MSGKRLPRFVLDIALAFVPDLPLDYDYEHEHRFAEHECQADQGL